MISYAYDPLYRLSAAAYSTGECYQYAYDKVGNRTTQTATITSTLVTNYAYDVADRLTTVNGQTYTWDSNGSLTNNGKFAFAYNNAGRMSQAQGITATQVYTYNGDGLLMNRNGARYVWDQAADLPQLLSDGNTLYVPGVGQWNGTSWAYELPDGLGSVRQLADAQGNIVQRYDYSPFGEVVAAQGTRSSKLQYTGEQNDIDTGLIYLRARWYDPFTGRFTSRDPFRGLAGLPQSQHPYVYAHNNPINLTDPSGELVTPDMLWDAAMVLIDAGFLIWDALNPCLDQATREQLMGQDLLFLGADATAFFIPFLPGGGGVALLGRGAAALAETVVRVPEVIRFGQAVQKGVQIGTHLAETSRGSGSGYRSVDDAQRKLDEWNVPDNLSRSDSRHLDAARRELLGEQLPGSKPGGHIREVQSARRGLRKALDRIQGTIGSGAWGVEARQYLVEQQSLIQKRLDRIKDVLGY